jgi:hypothetical protein
MKAEEAKGWEESRQNGRRKFVMNKGVFAWGIPMFLLTCFMYPPKSGLGFVAMVFWWIFVSAIYGAVTWHFQEKAFAKFNRMQEPQ